jgi:hypothetical protein
MLLQMRKIVTIWVIVFTNQFLNAQIKDTIVTSKSEQSYTLSNGDIYTYKKPKFFDVITKVPRDVVGTVSDFGKTQNLIALGGSAVVTVALLPADQYLLEKSRDIGEKIGLKDVARYNNFGPLSNIPPNATSAIYLIGNGTTPILLGIGFATYGLIKNDYRALNTASGLIESLAVSGVFSQTIKRISGRQSPAPALLDGNPGGNWNPFPSFSAFAKQTPNYDAMPSGHVMTATSALYVILGNYPDVQWIKPVGYGLIGILGFEMVQANVHWYSDYPIAMVMGYIIGKNIANSKIEKKSPAKEKIKKYAFHLDASRAYGLNMIGVNITF